MNNFNIEESEYLESNFFIGCKGGEVDTNVEEIDDLTDDETYEDDFDDDDETIDDDSELDAENGDSEEEESFYNDSEIPSELQGTYKKMQGAFTKKTQELADLRKSTQIDADRIKWLNDFDAMAATDPAKAAEFLTFIASQLNPNGKVSQMENKRQGFDFMQHDWEEESPAVQALAKMVGELAPMIKQINGLTTQHERQFATQKQQTELTKLHNEFGEFDDQKVLAAASALPAGTPLRLVVAETLLPTFKKKQTMKENVKHKKAATPPSSSRSSSAPVEKVTSFEDAVRLATKGIRV